MSLFKKFRAFFERMMLAITFSEQGEHDTALDYLYDGAKIEKKNKRYFEKFIRIFDKQQEAITFAEADNSEHAIDILTEKKEKTQRPVKLLVMGREGDFSQYVINYALEMANRFSYSIMALSTAPLSCNTFKLFASSRSKICDEFENTAKENVIPFQEAAVGEGISFDHVIMFNSPEEALNIVAKDNDIAFVVSDFIENRTEEEIEDRVEQRPHNSLFVYSIAT